MLTLVDLLCGTNCAVCEGVGDLCAGSVRRYDVLVRLTLRSLIISIYSMPDSLALLIQRT